MTWRLRILGFVAATAFIAVPAAAQSPVVGVASVIDGDTLEIHGKRIRLHGIDAPESGQFCDKDGKQYRCGQQAALALSDSIGRATIRCEQRDIDRYKRIVAVCRLGDRETAFIAARDSFYMATTGETGWPYVQHRGGPPGFLSVLDGQTLAFPDFRGNRQFISAGNLLHDDRVSVFLMDYANRARLKLFGRASVSDAPAVLEKLALPDYRARIERAFVIRLEAFDWNCSQHITPRYTDAEVETLVAPLQARIGELEAQLAAANLRPGPGEYPA